MAIKLTIEEIEAAIFSQMHPDRLKVAWLIGHAFPKIAEQPDDADIDSALLRLKIRSDVEAFGDITNWRYSEMRRVESKI